MSASSDSLCSEGNPRRLLHGIVSRSPATVNHCVAKNRPSPGMTFTRPRVYYNAALHPRMDRTVVRDRSAGFAGLQREGRAWSHHSGIETAIIRHHVV